MGSSVLAGGIRTNFHDLGPARVTGEGRREEVGAVLLLHGSGPGVTAFANWRLTMPVLAEQRRVVAPDLVGFGYTERPAGFRYELRAWVQHLVAFLDVLGLERVDVVGNSFGGALALALALTERARVRRLVLMGSVGLRFPITAGLEAVWGYVPSLEAMRHLLELFVYDRSRIDEALVRSRYEASAGAAEAEAWARLFPPPRQERLDALAVPEDELRGLDVPALVVHGRDDLVIPVETSYRLASLLPVGDLHVFARCGHWTQIEHAARFNALVDDFLRAEPL
ncbi:MAG: alpha/beta fold hydrolase [Actinomycetota bacterium]|nr:alpha/beta fold hydrolase [Actinomycetota bacterium]